MINPIILIIVAIILLCTAVPCIFHKPQKLILTGVTLLLLAFFVCVTWYIESCMESTMSHTGLLNFLVLSDNPTYNQLSESFKTCQIIDIFLFAAVIISMIYEVHNIFKWSMGRKR